MDQITTEQYTIVNGDCISVMVALPEKSIGMSMYSLPFRGMYQYSSSTRDLSNCRTKEQFMEHYESEKGSKLELPDYIVEDIQRRKEKKAEENTRKKLAKSKESALPIFHHYHLHHSQQSLLSPSLT